MRFIDNKGTINVGMAWFEVELVFVANLCAVLGGLRVVSVLGNWQLGRSRTGLGLSSQRSKMGGNCGGGGMIVIPLCA